MYVDGGGLRICQEDVLAAALYTIIMRADVVGGDVLLQPLASRPCPTESLGSKHEAQVQFSQLPAFADDTPVCENLQRSSPRASQSLGTTWEYSKQPTVTNLTIISFFFGLR